MGPNDELMAAISRLAKAWDTDEPDPDESWQWALNEMTEAVFSAKMTPVRAVIDAYRSYVARKMVDDWNRDHDGGIIVDVTLDDGSVVRTVTRTSANLLGGHTPVVWLQSIPGGHRFSGCYALDRVTPVRAMTEAEEETLEYNRAGGGAECPACGVALRDHPDDLDHPGSNGHPFLVRRCDGSLVKL